MNYTLNQLRIYARVAETLSITKAAEELHLTQPAVSIQLKNFQDQFSLPLTEVINRRLYITDFGREIADAANSILEEVQGIQQRLNAHMGLLTGKLRISVVSTGKYIAPFFLSDFTQQHPGVELEMDVTNKARVLESMEQNEVDFSLVSVLPDHLRIGKLELMPNRLFLVGGAGSTLKGKQYDQKVLEDLPLIFREPGSGTRHVMEAYFKKHRLKVNKKLELNTNEAVKQAVIAGLGYSLMPLIGIHTELENRQLRIIPVKGFSMQSTWYFIWLKDKKHSPAAKAYLEHLRSHREQIVKEKFHWLGKY